VVHAGARLGSDGFGYVFGDGAHRKVPHVGRCIVGDDVEIGANTTIDRGSVDDTVIGAGTKIDNLVHLGHNVRVGRLCLLMAQVGVAGSAVIEDGAILAGQVGVGGHLTVGRGARVGGQVRRDGGRAGGRNVQRLPGPSAPRGAADAGRAFPSGRALSGRSSGLLALRGPADVGGARA
jgi:UDP-3-O-[3-hydroxymyristoyl] glucosamine N-acyltransferase